MAVAEGEFTTDLVARVLHLSIYRFRKLVHKIGMVPRTAPNRQHRWIFNDAEVEQIREGMKRFRRKGDY